MTKIRSVRGRVKGLTAEDFIGKQMGDEYHFETYASRPVIDRYGEVVEVSAFEKSLDLYRRNPVMLYMHNPMAPIGRFPSLDLRADGLFVRGIIGHGFEPADTARLQVEQGVLRAVSIGFRETQRGSVDRDGIYHITGLDLLEISLVSVPANQEAVFQFAESDQLADIVLIPEDEQEVEEARLDAMAIRRAYSIGSTVTIKSTSSEDPPPSDTTLPGDTAPSPSSEPVVDLAALGDALATAGESGQLAATVGALSERIEQLEATQARLDDVELAVSIMLETQLSNLAAIEGTSMVALINDSSAADAAS